MSVIYVAGARSGAGATTVACGLAALRRAGGRRAALVKPLSMSGGYGGGDASGCNSESGGYGGSIGGNGASGGGYGGSNGGGDGSSGGDPAFFASLGGSAATVAAAGAPSDAQLDEAARIISDAASGAQDVIVEGPPLDAPYGASAALAQRLGAPVVGVIPYERTLDGGVCAAWRESYGAALAGCVVNKRARYAEHDACARLAPELARSGMPVFGVLPEERLLLAPTVGQTASLLNGVYFAGEDGADALIENFLIGGLIAEWGGAYFGRLPNQAVIVRGGRMDIQMSALNFPLNALFLTRCEAPAQYVHQRAEELDVPLIAVAERDTHETAAAIETLGAAATVHHPAKAERAGAMALERLDAAALSAAVGG